MDNSPTALFDSYEQDFKQIVASIREKLESGDENERGGECQVMVLRVTEQERDMSRGRGGRFLHSGQVANSIS